MTHDRTPRPVELAHRTSAGIDVTLLWTKHVPEDEAVVCVCDHRNGAYFEITPEPYLALEVYYHPFFYRDFSSVEYEDSRLAASSPSPMAPTSRNRVRAQP
jgi:hypothetical protein